MSNVKTVGLAVAVIVIAASPAFAQTVGSFGTPVEFINSSVRTALTAAAAIASGAGIYKGVQVWSGQRQWSEAATAWFAGAAFMFGVAAAVGFS